MTKKTKKNNIVKKTVKTSKSLKNKNTTKGKVLHPSKIASAKKNSKPAKKAVKATSKAKPEKAIKKLGKATGKSIKTSKAEKPVTTAKPIKISKPSGSLPAAKTEKKSPIPVKVVTKTEAASKGKNNAQKPGEPKAKSKAVKAEMPVKLGSSAQPKAQRPPERRRKQEVKTPITEFKEDGTPVNMVKLNKKSYLHAEPSRVISAPVVAPKPTVMAADKKKEPKGRFQMEYIVNASAELLFEFLTTPSGLSEWFADDVNIRHGIYTFFWDEAEQQAKLVGYKEPRMVRFQWVDKTDGSYFEFSIEVDELTRDTSLVITDFAEDPAEQHTSKLLWDSQVNKLLHVIGAYN